MPTAQRSTYVGRHRRHIGQWYGRPTYRPRGKSAFTVPGGRHLFRPINESLIRALGIK